MSGEPRQAGEAPPSTIDLLDALDALLNEAHRVPFSGSVMVNEQDLLQLMDRIRLSLPQDVVRAQRLLDERERVLRDTQERAQDVTEVAAMTARERVERAEEQARGLLERAHDEALQLGEAAATEAGRLVADAEARAAHLVAEHSVVRAAEERGAILLREAEARALAVSAEAEAYSRDADDYVRTVMTELEAHLVAVTETVRKGLGSLAGPAPSAARRRGGRRG
jgi:vacuolar-type H+-ATPase subunit H